MGNAASDFEKIGDAFGAAFDPERNGLAQSARDSFSDARWNPSKNGFNDAFESFGSSVNDLFSNDIIPWFEDLGQGFVDVGNMWYEGAKSITEDIGDAFKPVADGLEYAFSDQIWNPNSNGVSDAFNNFGDSVQTWFEEDFVNFWVDDVGGAFVDLGNMWWEGAQDIYNDVIKPGYEWVADKAKEVFDTTGDIWDIFRKLIKFVKDYWWAVLLGIVTFQFGPSVINAYYKR